MLRALSMRGAENRETTQVTDDWSIRLFNVIDNFNAEGLEIGVGFSLPSKHVICLLDHINDWRDKPEAIRCNSGLNTSARAL
jgi:putative transposase